MSVMPTEPDLEKLLEKLANRTREKTRVGGNSIEKTLTKARAHFSGKAVRDIDLILEALQMATHPRLAKQIDVAAVELAAKDLMVRLKAVNIARDRERRVFDIGFTMVFNLLLLGVCLVGFLLWQGIL